MGFWGGMGAGTVKSKQSKLDLSLIIPVEFLANINQFIPYLKANTCLFWAHDRFNYALGWPHGVKIGPCLGQIQLNWTHLQVAAISMIYPGASIVLHSLLFFKK